MKRLHVRSILALALASPLALAAEIEIIAVTNAPVPGIDGAFFDGLTSPPSINDSGHVSFPTLITYSAPPWFDYAVFVHKDSSVQPVIRASDMPWNYTSVDPNGPEPGRLPEIDIATITDAGDVVFTARYNAGTEHLVTRKLSGSTLTDILVDGVTQEDVFCSPSCPSAVLEHFGNGWWNLVHHSSGNIALAAFNFENPGSDQLYYFRHYEPSGLTEALALPSPAYSGAQCFRMNTDRVMAFSVKFTPSFGPVTNHVFRTSSPSFTTVADSGTPAPDGNGTFGTGGFGFDFASVCPINDDNQVAFVGRLLGTANPPDDTYGVFRGEADNSITQIARGGQPSPDGDGYFSEITIGQEIAMNEGGWVLFHAKLSGTDGGSSDNEGLFLGNGSELRTIVRKGDTVPGGNGKFDILIPWQGNYLNNVNQVVFFARLSNTSGGGSDDGGLFRYNRRMGVREIIRYGALVDSAVVWSLSMWSGSVGSGYHRYFNDAGAVVFQASLLDGRRAICKVRMPVYPKQP